MSSDVLLLYLSIFFQTQGIDSDFVIESAACEKKRGEREEAEQEFDVSVSR